MLVGYEEEEKKEEEEKRRRKTEKDKEHSYTHTCIEQRKRMRKTMLKQQKM